MIISKGFADLDVVIKDVKFPAAIILFLLVNLNSPPRFFIFVLKRRITSCHSAARLTFSPFGTDTLTEVANSYRIWFLETN